MLSQGVQATNFKKLLEEAKRHVNTMSALPNTFHDAISYFSKRAGLTQEDLFELTNIAPRTIQRWRDKPPANIESVICICFALKLNYLESIELLRKAGLVLRDSDPQHMLFAFILQKGEYSNLDEINAEFMKNGIKQLGGRSER